MSHKTICATFVTCNLLVRPLKRRNHAVVRLAPPHNNPTMVKYRDKDGLTVLDPHDIGVFGALEIDRQKSVPIIIRKVG